MQHVLIDLNQCRSNLLPLTYTKPISELRVGIFTIKEKWEKYLENTFSVSSAPFLEPKYPRPSAEDSLVINASVLPGEPLASEIAELRSNESLYIDDVFIAARTSSFDRENFLNTNGSFSKKQSQNVLNRIEFTWDIFRNNGDEIRKDLELIKRERSSVDISDPYTKIYGENIFIEEGASVKDATLNAENGPIYIGKDAKVHEGSLIKGPFALCEGSHVNMGGKIKGDSTIGPFSKVGGEISNSVIQGYSNKGHDGFLGNAVIGEWCNLGADTNNSNLKNNYTEIKMWNYEAGRFLNTGLQFCGLIMADHSKCGINTMFNTGTTVGVSANIFGEGFPRNFIPSFSWGGAHGFITFKLEKAYETAEKMMERRNVPLTEGDKAILKHVFETTSQYRSWEKKKAS